MTGTRLARTRMATAITAVSSVSQAETSDAAQIMVLANRYQLEGSMPAAVDAQPVRTVSIVIPVADADRLRDLARSEHRSFSGQVRVAVEQHLAQVEHPAKDTA